MRSTNEMMPDWPLFAFDDDGMPLAQCNDCGRLVPIWNELPKPETHKTTGDTMSFRPAVKRDAKGRVALIGPGGSGKSYTALTLARLLAGPTGKIAAVDTEHGSLSKYAHTDTCRKNAEAICTDPSHFDFDVQEFDVFSPENFLKGLDEAEAQNYDVFLADSLSHFWMGAGGALEFVDAATNRNKGKGNHDGMSGWKDFRPHERKMIDRMIASPCHVICTMRTKNEYTEVEKNGKKTRVKIGLAPVQRDGLEYEFDLVGLMDDDNSLSIDKTRCSFYQGKMLTKPDRKDFEPFQAWLKGAKVVAPSPAPARAEGAAIAGTTGHPASAAVPAIEVPEPLKALVAGLAAKGGAKAAFDFVKAELLEALPQSGGAQYIAILQKHGIKPSGPQITRVLTESIVEIWKLAQWAKEAAAAATRAAQASAEPLPVEDEPVIDVTPDPPPAAAAQSEAA